MKPNYHNSLGAKLPVPEPIGYRKKDTYGCAAIAGTGCLIYVVIAIVAVVTFLIAAYHLLSIFIAIIKHGKIGG